nr:hypothetical protein [Trichlorobacter sp.]
MILLIFPDLTVMLYDCNVTEDNKQRVLGYLENHIPSRLNHATLQQEKWIDIYVNSHRDQDHYRGLSSVKEIFDVRQIWDSGETGATTQDTDYQYYMRLRRRLIEQNGKSAVFVPTPSLKPILSLGGAAIYCLNSSEDVVLSRPQSEYLAEAKVQHTNSIVLSITYSGHNIMLPSDSDWHAWKDHIIPVFKGKTCLNGDILVASHHGSRSFFTDENNDGIDLKQNPDTTYLDALKLIDPKITLISCGDYSQYHHPNVDALKEYKLHTSNKQVYTTNAKGTFAGCINSDGTWTVVPSRFRSKSIGSGNFDIRCISTCEGQSVTINSGATVRTGSSLEFSIAVSGGITDPQDSVEVWWEVSNGGVGLDHDHQEIYYKDKNESGGKYKFTRVVSYKGTHLLRVYLSNKKKRIYLTRIFVVTGK